MSTQEGFLCAPVVANSHITVVVQSAPEGSKGYALLMQSSIAESFTPNALKNKQIASVIRIKALLTKL